jgi:hypothetical protein
VKRFGFYIGVLATLLLGLLMTVASPALTSTARHLPSHRLAATTAQLAATPAQLETAYHGTVHADDGQNTYDAAIGKVVIFTGDATYVDPDGNDGDGVAYGTSTNLCFPHGTIVEGAPGSTSFSVLPQKYGCGWQPVPNTDCPTGGQYWFGSALATSSTIYNYGACVIPHSDGSVTNQGNFVAAFSASTLALESFTPVTGPAQYMSLAGTPAPWTGGHWLIGTTYVSSTDCTMYATDCRKGQAIWIPAGDEARPSLWTFHSQLPVKLDIGTAVSLIRSNSNWIAISKQGDQFGGTVIEELSAGSAIEGATWSLTGKTWATASSTGCSAPSGFCTYSAQFSAEPAPSGQVTATYAENDSGYYGLHWLDLTL